MAFHSILKNSRDYTEALRWSRRLTDSLQAKMNQNEGGEEEMQVFSYSVFYVFYEQYLTMWTDTLQSLGVSLAAIFLVTFCLMGFDLSSSLIILLVSKREKLRRNLAGGSLGNFVVVTCQGKSLRGLTKDVKSGLLLTYVWPSSTRM